MSINLNFIISYHYSLLLKLSNSLKSFKLFAFSVTSFSHTSSTHFISTLSCLTQSLQNSLLNHLMIKIDLIFTDRQSNSSDDHVVSVNTLSSCHAAAVSENNFDKMLRSCKLIKVMNDINFDMQDSTQHFNTAEDDVHQCNSDSVIRNTSLFV